MRVLHVLKDLEPGGIQVLLLDMLNNASHFDGEMALFLIGKGRMFDGFKESAKENFYSANRRYLIDIKLCDKIRKAASDFDADIVHTHHTAEMFHAWLSFRKNKKIKLVHTHHVSPQSFTKKDEFIIKLTEKYFDAVFVPSNTLKQKMIKLKYPKSKDYKVVYNGIDKNRISSNHTKSECREMFGLAEDDIIIGMAGSFYNNIRDQYSLCKVFNSIASKNENFKLVFAGAHSSEYFSDDYYQKCKNFVEENSIFDKVIFLNHIENINDFYKMLDIYVHYSKNDTFGIAAVEALIAGCKICVPQSDIFSEIFSKNQNILFFNNFNNLSEILLRSSFLKHKKNQYSDLYIIDNYINRLFEKYKALLK